MMLKRLYWLLLPFTLLAACTQGGVTPVGPGTPTVGQPEPYSVAGVAVDTQGRAIAGAKVWIEPALTTGLAEVTTDGDGRYLVNLSSGFPSQAKKYLLGWE